MDWMTGAIFSASDRVPKTHRIFFLNSHAGIDECLWVRVIGYMGKLAEV